LVTGLCLSRNRGGAAMALSFADLIKTYVPVDFLFAVDAAFLPFERKMADHYGLKVVACDNLLKWITTMPAAAQLIRVLSTTGLISSRDKTSNSAKRWQIIHRKYQEAIDRVDAVVNLNGIAFVGDRTRPWHSALTDRTSSVYARHHRKPFYRFIQSYGPFKDWRVRAIARSEFRHLPCIMARGKIAARFCREIAKQTPVYAFPDVAVTLAPADARWLDRYLEKLKLLRKKYVVLSPSSMISSLPVKTGHATGDRHIAMFAEIAKHYIVQGMPVLFIPHATSPTPHQCDRVASEKCIRMVEHRYSSQLQQCRLIEDELDCREFKALISGASMAVTSRYHALVAALSTGVPAVSVGWNEKYRDIMDYYGCGDFWVDARSGEFRTLAQRVIDKCHNWTPEQKSILKNRLSGVEKKVHVAGEIFSDWIKVVT